MAFAHGKDSSFKLDNAGGVLTDLGAYVTNVQVPKQIAMADTTTIGDSDASQIPGIKSGTITVTALSDPALITHLNGIYGLAATSSYEWGPHGTTNGLPRIFGECRLRQWTPASGVGNAAQLNFDCVLDGAQSLGTMP